MSEPISLELDDAPIGSVWDTGCGNHWRVEEYLPGKRVRVRCVYSKAWRDGDAPLETVTAVWPIALLTPGRRVGADQGAGI